MLLNSISGFLTLVFEVPTGVYADKVGRKNSVIIGLFFNILSFLVFVLTNDFKILLLSSLFGALSDAFISGADSALLYESMKYANRLEEYDKTISNIHSLCFYASAITAITSSLLYDLNKYFPMYLSIIFLTVAMIISFSFKEPPKEEKKSAEVKLDIKTQFVSYFQHIQESFKYVYSNRDVLYTIFLYFIFMLYISNMNYLSQPYMQDIGIPVIYFGIIFFVFNIIAANSAKLSHLFKNRFKDTSFNIIIIQMVICFLLLGLTRNWYGVLLLMFGRIATGLTWPLLDSRLNNQIPSKQRATIISLKSFVVSLSFVIFDPIIGFLIDCFNIFTTYLILGVSLLSVYIVVKLTGIRRIKSKFFRLKEQLR
ncbi:hypothetical protein BBF96_13500 [Anoxybacter fermentans]|uniref:Major facilitator superfamily (MFS) profile domain-containing protein n=2 Tax=Anoxybacter fermentans TaxID=1323375 RepID=A0A3S9T128_9FIRM|nr:hypothetical protein BBF96_13500 [Anoxybacter fermentans]